MLGSNKGSQVDREAGKESEAVIVTFNEAQYATMSIAEQRQQLPVYKHRKSFFYPLLIFFALSVEGCDGYLSACCCPLWEKKALILRTLFGTTGTEFLYLLENHQVVILVGQTGSGKTTRKDSNIVRRCCIC